MGMSGSYLKFDVCRTTSACSVCLPTVDFLRLSTFDLSCTLPVFIAAFLTGLLGREGWILSVFSDLWSLAMVRNNPCFILWMMKDDEAGL